MHAQTGLHSHIQLSINKLLTLYHPSPPFSSDNRCYGPVWRPDWSGLPPGWSTCGAPLGQDGAVRCGAQVSGPHSNHCLYTGLSWPLHPSCPGISEKSCSTVPQTFHFQHFQWPHGPAESLSGRQGSIYDVCFEVNIGSAWFNKGL